MKMRDARLPTGDVGKPWSVRPGKNFETFRLLETSKNNLSVRAHVRTQTSTRFSGLCNLMSTDTICIPAELWTSLRCGETRNMHALLRCCVLVSRTDRASDSQTREPKTLHQERIAYLSRFFLVTIIQSQPMLKV